MTGALLVTFFCIIMPITAIVLGLKLGYPFASQVWDSLALMFRTTGEWMLPEKPEPYDPPPIMFMRDDELDAKVKSIIEGRTRNPRLAKEMKAMDMWLDKFHEDEMTREELEYLECEDEEDEVTISDWERKHFKAGMIHTKNQTCYICEGKRQ